MNRGLVSAAALLGTGLGLASAALGSTLPVAEVGNTRASATNIESNFTLDSNANIFNSTTVPHVSISSTNNSTTDVDWFSFTGSDYAEVYIDIDCGFGCGVSFDPLVAIFDENGAMIAYDNDANPADPGSSASQDPFIGRYFLPGSFTGSATYYVSVSSGFPNGLGSCSGFFQLQRPDGQFGGWEVTGCAANDTFAAGSYSTGDYTLHISLTSPPVLGPNYDGQLSDQPKYRWLEPPAPNPFQPELVAAANYSTGPGICQMNVPTPATCSNIGSQPGCILVGYGFAPSPPASGFECCGYQAKCELTCPVNSCVGGEVCPPSCSDQPGAFPRCWDETLANCSNEGNQAACDAEEARLRALNPTVPDCCFFGRATKIYRWGSRVNETPIHSDVDVFPNQCDNCPQTANDTQADGDGDQRGDACDSFPTRRYQCADTDADLCDDCKSGSYDPANDHNPCINPAPEPGVLLSLIAGSTLVAALARAPHRR